VLIVQVAFSAVSDEEGKKGRREVGGKKKQKDCLSAKNKALRW
jgi:hypothetical protein